MAIFDVIKYEGDNRTFVWKHPCEDFNTKSQLIVHQSQEALFFSNGEALDLFGPGRHVLSTENIPFLRRLINIPFGGETPFHAEVFFINKTEQMAIKWGTDNKVEFFEPTYHVPIKLGACGEMSLRIEDSRKLLVKIVGTEGILGQEGLVANFRAFLMTRVKTYLVTTIKQQKISIFEIDEHLASLSDALKALLVPDFAEYGIKLERFMVTTVVKPEGEPGYERIKQIHLRQFADVAEAQIRQNVGIIDQTTEATRTVIAAQGFSQKRTIEGYTYQQERAYDVAEKIGENEGIGNFTNAGIGIGMMAGIGGSVSPIVGGVLSDALSPLAPQAKQNADPNNEPSLQGVYVDLNKVSPSAGGLGAESATNKEAQPSGFCEKCGSKIVAESEFCEECGEPVASKPACTKCGFVFIKESKFCPKCGTKRDEIL